MPTITIEEHLAFINAPAGFQEWAKGKTAQQVFDDCYRPDWLFFWAAAVDPTDRQARVIVIGTVDCLPSDGPWQAVNDTYSHRPTDPARVEAWEKWCTWAASVPCQREGHEGKSWLEYFGSRCCRSLRMVRLGGLFRHLESLFGITDTIGEELARENA